MTLTAFKNTDTIKHEIYDFDGTLYPYPKNFSTHVERRVASTMRSFGVNDPRKKIIAAAQKSYKENGHSLIGLIEQHDLDFHKAYDEQHRRLNPKIIKIGPKHAKALQDFYDHCQNIGSMLSRTLLTHSTQEWTIPALNRVRLTDIFDITKGNVITAEDYRYKNDAHKLMQYFKHDSVIPYLHTCIVRDIDPRQCRMVEDSLKNLEPAKLLGMQTVYIHHRNNPLPELPPYVDFQVRDISKIADLSLTNTLPDTFDHATVNRLLHDMREIINNGGTIKSSKFRLSEIQQLTALSL